MVMSSCPNTFNPVKRGLVKEPAEWEWSSFRHYAIGKSSLPGDPQECFPAQVSAKVRREPGAPRHGVRYRHALIRDFDLSSAAEAGRFRVWIAGLKPCAAQKLWICKLGFG